MRVIVKIRVDSLDVVLKKRNLEEGGKAQEYIDSEAIRLMAPYTPKMDGTLIDSATVLTKMKEGKIGTGRIWQGGDDPNNEDLAPYGRKHYYKQANFTGAPIRGTRWFERMKNNGGKESILKGVKRIAGAK